MVLAAAGGEYEILALHHVQLFLKPGSLHFWEQHDKLPVVH